MIQEKVIHPDQEYVDSLIVEKLPGLTDEQIRLLIASLVARAKSRSVVLSVKSGSRSEACYLARALEIASMRDASRSSDVTVYFSNGSIVEFEDKK